MENPEGYPVLTDADVAAMEAPAERDWSKWLPPHPLLDTGPKKFWRGQVWAVSYESGNPCTGVVRIVDNCRATVVLASPVVPAGTWGRFPSADSFDARHAVLVQDVGQPEPTPPEVLYGPAPGQWWATKDGGGIPFKLVDRLKDGYWYGVYHNGGTLRASEAWVTQECKRVSEPPPFAVVPVVASPAPVGELLPGDVIALAKPYAGASTWRLVKQLPQTSTFLWQAEPFDEKTGMFMHWMELHFAPTDVAKVVPAWRAGQRRRVWNSADEARDGTVVSESDFAGRFIFRLDSGIEAHVPSEWRSELLAEAPAAAGQTTEGRKTAILHRPLDHEKVARARAAIEQLTARMTAALSPPSARVAESAVEYLKTLENWMDVKEDADLRDYYDKVAPITPEQWKPIPLEDIVTVTISVAGPVQKFALPRPALREVSSNGREWVTYESDNPYPFDSFKRRRIDGVDVGYVDPPVLACAEPMTKPCSNPASWRIIKEGMVRLCDKHNVAMDTLDRRCSDAGEGPPAARARMAGMDRNVSAAPLSEPSCQPALFGGIWRPW